MSQFLAILFAICYLLFAVPQAQGFVGPGTNAPGSGGGMFSVDPNRNIGFGTQGVVASSTHATPPYADPYGSSKIFMIASTSSPPGFGLRNLGQDLSGYDSGTYSLRPATYLLRLTPWGGFTIFDASEINNYSGTVSRYRFTIHPNGGVTIGSDVNTVDAPPPPPTGETAGKLEVFGSIKSIGGSFIGTLSGSLSAANVIGPSAFGANYGTYNYAFPGALAVGTSTTAGLPTEGLYVKGNVGIGTTGPGAKLSVLSSASSYGMLRVNYDSASEGEASMGFFGTNAGDTNDAWVIGAGGWSNTGDFVIGNENNGAGGNVRLLIEKSGNVGIGTTGPDSKLNVISTASIDGIKIEALNRASLWLYDTNTGDANRRNWLIQTEASAAGNFEIKSSTAALGTPSATRLTIDRTGNVGIGTVTPQTLLTLQSGSYPGIAVGESSSIYGFMEWDHLNNKLNIQTTGHSYPILIGNNWAYFKTNGNVGIGTTAPLGKLHLFADTASADGVLRLETSTNDSATSAFDIQFKNTGVTATGYAGIRASNPSSNVTNLEFLNWDGDSREVRMGIYGTNGNVGIGTTSPGAKLDILTSNSHGDNAGSIRIKSSSGTNVLKFGIDGTNNFAELRAYTPDVGDNSKLVLQPYGGNVGIGTTNPTSTLQIAGTFKTEVGGGRAFTDSGGNFIVEL